MLKVIYKCDHNKTTHKVKAEKGRET